jgi:cytochrome c
MIKRREWVIKTFGVPYPVAPMGKAVLALLSSSAVLPSEAEAQGGQDGQALFQKHCSGCHAPDDDHEGPRLRGVVGKVASTVKSLLIFGTLKDAKNMWREGTLDKWLTVTESVVPDNAKSF